MIAHLLQLNEQNFGNTMSDQLVLAMQSHRDINTVMTQDLDYSTLSYYVLFPNFAANFDDFVHKLVLERGVSLNVKLRYLSFLIIVKVFMAKDCKAITENLKYCFDLILYLRASTSNEDYWTERVNDFLEPPLLNNNEDKILQAIRIILEN